MTNWSDIFPSTTATGAGSGEINYILNPDAETDTTGWATYDDGASATPVDGTGGSPATMTLTSQASTVLRGDKSFKLLKSAADGQGEGISYDFTIKEADKNKLLKIELDYKVEDVSGTAYASDDFAVYIYDVTNTTLITPSSTGIAEYDSANDGAGKFLVSWSATDSASYRLIIHQTTTSTGSYALYFDNVIVGPGSIVTGAAVNAWEDSPNAWTVTGLTIAGDVAYSAQVSRQRRVGDSIEVVGQIIFSTITTAPTGYWVISLPFDENTDLSKAVSGTELIGHGLYTDASSTDYQFSVLWDNGDPTRGRTYLYFEQTASGAPPATVASGDRLYINYTVPIAEWAGSGTQYQLNNNLVAANARFHVVGLTSDQTIGTASETAIANWDTANYSIQGGGSFDGENYTVPVDGWYEVNACIRWSGSGLTGTDFHISVRKNGSIVMSEYLEMNSDFYPTQRVHYLAELSKDDVIDISCYQNTGGNVNVRQNDNETQFSVKRVADYSATQPVGFGLADASNAGLIGSYEEYTHSSTYTWNGSGGTSSSVDAYIVKVGNMVTISFPTIGATTGTSSTTLTGDTAIPAAYRPSRNVRTMCPLYQNGTALSAVGFVQINSSGSVIIIKTDGATFSNSQPSTGLNNSVSFSYPLT
jgi:hypothetical protein